MFSERRTGRRPVHWTQNLDVPNWVEAEAIGDPCLHQLDDALYGGFRIVRLHEVEIAIRAGQAEIGDEPVIDAMSADDDAALRGLPEHLGETHHRHSTG